MSSTDEQPIEPDEDSLTDVDDRVFASMVTELIMAGTAMGIPRETLVEIAGVPEPDLADPDGLVDYEAPLRLWSAFVQRFPTMPLGLGFAQRIEDRAASLLGVVGYATRNCRDVRQALELFIRFTPLSFPRMNLQLEIIGDRARLLADHEPRVVALIEPMELFVATMVRQLPQVNAAIPTPTEVCFRHARKHPAELYTEVLRAPVHFNAPWTGFAFDAAVLELPVTGADPQIGRYLAQHADALLEARDPLDAQTPIEVRVRSIIDANLMAGTSNQVTVAQALGRSTRSLQRALADRGTSFARQLEEVRRERAAQLLRRAELSVAEVAFMLGYTNPRAFYRSFRRWTGRTPSEYRRQRSATTV